MKVVGYYKAEDTPKIVDALYNIKIEALTHLFYAFLLPVGDGSVYFRDDEIAEKTVNYCHEKGVKVYVSVGGSHDGEIRLEGAFQSICESREKIDVFVQNTVEVVKKYGFDGIDLDWEYPWIEYKEPFLYMVKAFRKAADSLEIGFTIAIHRAIEGEFKYNRLESITDEVIENADWLNIMTYDDSDEDNHSSIDRCRNSVEYWTLTRGVPKEKLLVGIAFYGLPSQKPYSEIAYEGEDSAFGDFWNDDSYNGIYTVKDKCLLGKEYGGIIIWAVNFDLPASNPYSLLGEIGYLAKN